MTDVSIAQTHISILFFVGDRAYKLKKPVRYDFIDLSTRELREKICHREVALNRRLAPDVYLGVLDVTRDGDVIDHLVEMRRLPDDRRLATLLSSGSDVRDCVRCVAKTIAAFHAEAETSTEIATSGRPDVVRGWWQANLGEVDRFADGVLHTDTLARIADRADRYIAGREPLFAHRIDAGFIRDGHGDLLADDIFCLDDGPRILDCIEFDDRLRYADVVADIAFLAMDLERLGATDVAGRFIDWYREFSGERHPQTLAHHYIALRALIRSKVACLKHEQGAEGQAEQAVRLLEMADDHLDRARVRLVLVGGLPGTGKTTLASRIADATGWTVLSSDETRKELAGLRHDTRAGSAYGHGIYTEEFTDRTYTELLRRARELVENGECVVLDASWVDASRRAQTIAVAEETSTDVVELVCTLPADEAAARIARRTHGASDADERVAAAMAARMDPWPNARAVPTRVLEEATASALGACGRS